jgi:hypothetical protein
MTDIASASQFIASYARLIERRRLAVLEGDGDVEAVVRALDAYRNGDGGLGGLEPDLRPPDSQPACAMYALEILHEVGATAPSLCAGLMDWLQGATNADGGVPFVLPSARGWPHAPWFQPQDAPESSLLITAGIAAMAYRLGLDHPWLDRATEYCWSNVGQARSGLAYTFRSFVDFLDAVPDRGRAEAELDALADRIPADGLLRVNAGSEGEVLRPLEVVPRPDHAARRLFDDGLIERELDRLEAGQREDGGWTFTWKAWNPAAAWEWRGVVTVLALRTLRAYGRLELSPAAPS